MTEGANLVMGTLDKKTLYANSEEQQKCVPYLEHTCAAPGGQICCQPGGEGVDVGPSGVLEVGAAFLFICQPRPSHLPLSVREATGVGLFLYPAHPPACWQYRFCL